MLTPPSQRAGRRGLSSPITPSSLKAPRAISTALQTQLLPSCPGVTLFSLSILTGQLPLLSTRPLLATVAASETAAAWCFISPSPWQLAYSLTQRDPYLASAINLPPACVLGRRRGSPLVLHAAGSLAATTPASLLGLSHAGSGDGGAAVCPLRHHVRTPQAKSNSHPKKQYRKAGGFPSLQASWGHLYKPATSWSSSSFGQGAESCASPQGNRQSTGLRQKGSMAAPPSPHGKAAPSPPYPQ